MLRTTALAALLAALLPAAPALAQSPSPAATTCPTLRLEGDPDEAGNTATRVNSPLDVVVTSSDPASTYRLEILSPYTSPLRSGSGPRTVWTLRPNENSVVRVRSTVSGQYTCVSNPLRLYVEPAISISARRVGTREYVFTGRVLPGRQQTATLYRVTPQGPVITAQRRVDDDGTYFLGRYFASPGRYDFYVGVSGSRTNLAGQSPVRNTLVY